MVDARGIDYGQIAKLAEGYKALASQICAIADAYGQTHAELEQLAGQKKPAPQRLAKTSVVLNALALLLLTRVKEIGELELKIESDIPLPEAHIVKMPPLPAGARF